MGKTRTLLDSAAAAGLLSFPTQVAQHVYEANNLDGATEWVESFTEKAKGRATLFLGAAISTFKPTQLPMWNDFVQLLWASALEVATADMRPDRVSEGLLAFFERAKDRVPNYMVTEVISRRLGQQYLHVLDAFQAERLQDGTYAFNEIHKWAANLLATGAVAAVMTTNFDNYLEKAIEKRTPLFYQITGDPHVDGREISSRLSLTTAKSSLVLVVNGAKAFAFVRSLMPQLGNGKITFLFKVHGSCYDPVSCIDTRLQRAQGLPSFATDVLDILLKRTVWLVAGFSGSDMNDNLDYLRFISSKKEAAIIWLTYPGSRWESAIHRLTAVMTLEKGSRTGFCLVNGRFLGERHSEESKFPQFGQKILKWAQNLGPDWCKLLLVDLVALFEEKAEQTAPPHLLQAFNQGTSPRQDWNTILQNMDLKAEESQIAPAKSCSEVWALVNDALRTGHTLQKETRQDLCRRLTTGLEVLGGHHIRLQEAASRGDNPQVHAQAWVVNALSGLAMLCGGEVDRAARALEISSGIAWLVGNYEHHQMIERLLKAIFQAPHTSTDAEEEDDAPAPNQTVGCLAFSPAMDNVNSKMNKYGVPPQNYMRALLHRSILFADGMILPANIISNSTVLVDEVLFQGERDELNEVYLRHLYPALPTEFKDGPGKLRRFLDSRPKTFIFESVNDDHIARMDDFFDDPANAHQILYFDESLLGRNYGKYIRTAVDPLHRETTVSHLVRLWKHVEAGGGWSEHPDHSERSSAARHAAEDLTDSLFLLSTLLPEAVRRSPLYKFADLFDEASDRDSILAFLRSDAGEEAKLQLLKARDRIIEKPWLYSPFCHELFDAPYRAALAFDYASRAAVEPVLFLEEDEIPSWEFMSSDCHSKAFPTNFAAFPISADSHKYSSLLLSQMTTATLRKARRDLAPFRAKIVEGSPLVEDDVVRMKDAMASFESRSLALPDVEINALIDLDPNVKQVAELLLAQCVFLVRNGPPLDPMYEEAQIALPGLLALRRQQG
ncbi:hypothetical protein G647_04273 [Cladophialophora carrionii CBS 160.54]|uniref:SIR2-like domain-containing protein n=1 Tax=Cladophialophora carrionii CBS 160.54 TaxID=1279043 RepID=V9DF07_9EURO|nr:uncharacterized protein G647_04273 [Cladophialophora carrionii CBS 160.54]ETI24903.1 hypothetical protein G647_04273 [Cladophialophora carrionii CBS 160.54]